MIRKETSHYKDTRDDIDETFVDLSLSYYGWEECCPGHRWTDVRSTNYIHIILKGKGTFIINDKTYNLSAGDSFCIAANEKSTYYADLKDPWKYLWIGFSGTLSPDIIRQIGFSKSCPVLKISDTELFHTLIKKMLIASERTYIDTLKRRGLFLEFISEMMKLNESNSGSDSSEDCISEKAKEAYVYIKNNYTKPIGIQDIANSLGINRNYLSQLFKKKYSMSPKQFLQKTRMKNAVGLIYNKSLNIQQISYLVGYDDPCAFSKAFKNEYDVSPANFRKKISYENLE